MLQHSKAMTEYACVLATWLRYCVADLIKLWFALMYTLQRKFDSFGAIFMCAGTAQVDAHTVLLSIESVTFFAFPFGVATAATIRIGNLLGAGLPGAARKAAFVSISLGSLFLLVVGILMVVLRFRMGGFFVNDRDVIQVGFLRE